MKFLGVFIIGVFLFFVTFSCKKDKSIGVDLGFECVGGLVSYKDHIAPLISQSCATNLGPGTGCHDAWIFEYSNVKNIAESGVLRDVSVDSKYMPIVPNAFGIAPLTDDEVQLLSCWIYQGALDN